MSESKTFWRSIVFSIALISVLWIVKGYEWWSGSDWGNWGILPQHVSGLKGIVFAQYDTAVMD